MEQEQEYEWTKRVVLKPKYNYINNYRLFPLLNSKDINSLIIKIIIVSDFEVFMLSYDININTFVLYRSAITAAISICTFTTKFKYLTKRTLCMSMFI